MITSEEAKELYIHLIYHARARMNDKGIFGSSTLKIGDKISLKGIEDLQKLDDFITQQEKVMKMLKEVKQLLIDMSIEFDEYGMEPTTTTLRSGQEIKNTWFHKIMNKLESELNDNK